MKKSDAMKLWAVAFGDKEYAYDFAGRKIKKSDFGETNQVGWNVGFMHPLELGGRDYDGNTIIMHHNTIEEKALNYPDFECLNKKYTVQYDEKEDFYYIEKESNDESGFI